MKIVSKLEIAEIPVLAQPYYLMSIADVADYGYVVDNGVYLAFCIKNKFRLWEIVQLPSVLFGNVESMSQHETECFYNDAIKLICNEYAVDEIQNVNTSPCPVFPERSLYCKFGSYVLNLSLSVEELFSGIHSKHRNVIRKAEKDGLVVDHGLVYMQSCADIMVDTYRRQNKLCNANEELRKLEKLGNQCEFWVVKEGDIIQGCAVLLWDNKSCYYLHGGSISHTHSGAMNYLHWKAILEMKQRGVARYDFVGARVKPQQGSKLEGIQRFKARFGAPMEIGYLWRYDNHPMKMRIYRFLQKMYMLCKGDNSNIDVIEEERSKGNF